MAKTCKYCGQKSVLSFGEYGGDKASDIQRCSYCGRINKFPKGRRGQNLMPGLF